MKTQPSEKINVLLVNQFPYYSKGMESDLKDLPYIGEIYCCADGSEAIALIEEHKIDLIIMDADLPEMGGIYTTKEIIKTSKIDVKIIALFSKKEYFYFNAMRQSGAKGLLFKTATVKEIEEAINVVINLKKKYYTPEIDEIMADFEDSIKDGKKRKISFSKKQIEILKLAKSKPKLVRKELADKLDIEQSTLDTQIKRMYKKTNTNRMQELVKLAEGLGII